MRWRKREGDGGAVRPMLCLSLVKTMQRLKRSTRPVHQPLNGTAIVNRGWEEFERKSSTKPVEKGRWKEKGAVRARFQSITLMRKG